MLHPKMLLGKVNDFMQGFAMFSAIPTPATKPTVRPSSQEIIATSLRSHVLLKKLDQDCTQLDAISQRPGGYLRPNSTRWEPPGLSTGKLVFPSRHIGV